MKFSPNRTNIEKLAAEIKTMKIRSSTPNVGRKQSKTKRSKNAHKLPKCNKDNSATRKVIKVHTIHNLVFPYLKTHPFFQRNKSISVQTLSQLTLPHASQSTPSKKIRTEPNLHSKLLTKRNFATEATDSKFSSLIRIENYDDYIEKKRENLESAASFFED